MGVLISGRGSNLQALIDAAQSADYPAEIVLVISNVPSAQGLARAEEAGIATLTVNHKDFASREDFDVVLDETLRQAEIDILCNAGFMRLHTPGFVQAWRDRHLNIHPSLLPAFKGLHTHERVLEAEHQLYPLALRLVASGAVHVEGERVIGTQQGGDEFTLFAPALPRAL